MLQPIKVAQLKISDLKIERKFPKATSRLEVIHRNKLGIVARELNALNLEFVNIALVLNRKLF